MLWSIFQMVENSLAFIHTWFFYIEDLERPDRIYGSSLTTFQLTSSIEISHILLGVESLPLGQLVLNKSLNSLHQPTSLWLHPQIYFLLEPIQRLEASSPIWLISFLLRSSSIDCIGKWRGIHPKFNWITQRFPDVFGRSLSLFLSLHHALPFAHHRWINAGDQF